MDKAFGPDFDIPPGANFAPDASGSDHHALGADRSLATAARYSGLLTLVLVAVVKPRLLANHDGIGHRLELRAAFRTEIRLSLVFGSAFRAAHGLENIPGRGMRSEERGNRKRENGKGKGEMERD